MENSAQPKIDPLSGLIQKPTQKQILRFIIPSAIGVFIFLCPIIYKGNVNIPLGVASQWLADSIKPIATHLILIIVWISAVASLICTIGKPKAASEGKLLHSLFVTSSLFLIIRVVGAAITTAVFFKLGTEWVYGKDTGATMMNLMGILIAWFFAASFLIPLLLEYGIMDYTGTLIRKVLRPLFRLPGRSAVDLLASWIGNCNVGVVLTATQYEKGYYTAREAAIISTCFSAVSLPFCLVIAALLKVQEYFVPFYLILTVTGVLSVVIMSRIWPLGKINDTYYEAVGKQIDEIEPSNIKRSKWAFMQAVTKAQSGPSPGGLLKRGIEMFMGIIFTLVPVTMCVGTLALLLSTYTNVFDIIAVPFRYLFEVLGVEEAKAAAPAAVVGFADMFIPAVISANIISVKTRFIIGILSLVQIIYMSEVGSIILASKMPINIGHLFVIFLEKTVIAIPIIVILTNIFMPF